LFRVWKKSALILSVGSFALMRNVEKSGPHSKCGKIRMCKKAT
jgi:hypothetical protein